MNNKDFFNHRWTRYSLASAGDCCLCYCDGSFANTSVSVLTFTVAKQGTHSKLCRLIIKFCCMIA